MTKKLTEIVFGNTTGMDRPGTSAMLQRCSELGISAFMGIGSKGQEIYITHRDMIPRFPLGDAMSMLGVKPGMRLLLQPCYETNDERALECSRLVALALAAKNIGLVLLSKDAGLLAQIKEKRLNIETCLYIPNLSQSRDPLGVLQRLGCKHMATDYAVADCEAYGGIAETLKGNGGIDTWLFTGELTSRVPVGRSIYFISDDPEKFTGNRASRGKP